MISDIGARGRIVRTVRCAYTQDIRERLGGSRSVAEELPDKPKGMRWRTYERLRARAEEAEAASWTSALG